MSRYDNDFIQNLVGIAAILIVVLVIIGVFFTTSEANGEITQKLASECIAAGGTWLSGTTGGCVR